MLRNISRSEGNQGTEFDQLTEYNIRNIFLEKSYTKYGGKTIPRPFSEKSKLSKCLDQYKTQFVFLYVKLRAIKIY